MADITPLLSNPETIKQLNETIKIAIGAIGSIGGVITVWITILSKKTEQAAKSNTEITMVNTEALASHAKEMSDIKDSASHEVDEFKKYLAEIREDLSGELNKIKLVVVKVSNATDQKLGMLPRLEDAIKEHNDAIKDHNSRLIPLERDAEVIRLAIEKAKQGQKS